MKILHLVHHFHPCVGGMETHVRDLCLELRKRGHTADVLCLNTCSNGQKLPAQGTYKGIAITRVPYLNLKYYKIGRGVLDRIKGYDIVHVHGLGYFLDLLTSTKHVHKKRIILSTHGGFFHTNKLSRLKAVHFRTMIRLALKNVDSVVAVSEQDKHTFSTIRKKLIVIHNGISSTAFSRQGEKRSRSYISIGRVSANKRLDHLLATFHSVIDKEPAVTLLIVGEGPLVLLDEYRERVKRWGMEKSIRIPGGVSETHKHALLSHAQFFVSASAYEGFGIAVLEGMAAGCVPIVNDIPAFQDLLKGTGHLIDYSDPEKAAAAILRIMDQPINVQAVKNEAKKYEWKKIIKQWEQVYG